MLKGVRLTLMIGPAVPLPVPSEVMDSLTGIQVTSGTERSGFQLSFSVGKTSTLMTNWLPAGRLDPVITRVIIIVTVLGLPVVLADGMVTRQELSPSNDPGKSTLTVTGEDLSIVMDLVEMPFMRYPGSPDVAQIYQILAKYLALGIAPIAVPPVYLDAPMPTEQIPTHTGTDLEYIRQHARRAGYVFYVEPGPLPGVNVAYFGPDVRIPLPQRALNVNMDAHTNVESLSFSLDGTAKQISVITIMDTPTRKIPIPLPVPNISVLRPPMGLRPTLPAKVKFPQEMAKLKPGEAVKRALGISLAASDAISASGTLDVVRYGGVLQSRRMVGVRGAGRAYDGFYYVNSVTHNIKRGEYKQNFMISRDGMVANSPVVAP
jgi:hypothetical protein